MCVCVCTHVRVYAACARVCLCARSLCVCYEFRRSHALVAYVQRVSTRRIYRACTCTAPHTFIIHTRRLPTYTRNLLMSARSRRYTRSKARIARVDSDCVVLVYTSIVSTCSVLECRIAFWYGIQAHVRTYIQLRDCLARRRSSDNLAWF